MQSWGQRTMSKSWQICWSLLSDRSTSLRRCCLSAPTAVLPPNICYRGATRDMEHLTRLIIIPCQLEREECDVTAPHPLLSSDTTRGVSHITPTRWRHQRRDISLWSGPLSSARDSNICVQQLKFKFWTIQFMFVIIILTKIFLRLNRPLSQNQLYFHESWYDKYILHYSILFFISFIIDFEY